MEGRGQEGEKLSLTLRFEDEEQAPIALLLFAGERFVLARSIQPVESPPSGSKGTETSSQASGKRFLRQELTLPDGTLQRFAAATLHFVVATRDGQSTQLPLIAE